MPQRFLFPSSFDEMQGRQTWPSLVPKNFSRLLPHKAMIGTPCQKRVQDLPDRSVGFEGKQYAVGFHIHAAPPRQQLRPISEKCLPHRKGAEFRLTHVNKSSNDFHSLSVLITLQPKSFLIVSILYEPSLFSKKLKFKPKYSQRLSKSTNETPFISIPKHKGNADHLQIPLQSFSCGSHHSTVLVSPPYAALRKRTQVTQTSQKAYSPGRLSRNALPATFKSAF